MTVPGIALRTRIRITSQPLSRGRNYTQDAARRTQHATQDSVLRTQDTYSGLKKYSGLTYSVLGTQDSELHLQSLPNLLCLRQVLLRHGACFVEHRHDDLVLRGGLQGLVDRVDDVAMEGDGAVHVCAIEVRSVVRAEGLHLLSRFSVDLPAEIGVGGRDLLLCQLVFRVT